MHVHRAGVAHVIVLPHRLQHRLAAEHLAAVLDKQLQQVGWVVRRKMDLMRALTSSTLKGLVM